MGRDGDADRADRDAREEIRSHLEMRADDLRREGVPPEEATAQARQEFGDVDGAVDVMAAGARRMARREARRDRWTGLARDVKLTLRSFARRPLIPALVAITLAVGIGANTAVYSLVDALVFRPLPFGDGERLVRMRDATVRPDGQPWLYNTSARSFDFLRASAIFESITAQRYHRLRLTGQQEPLTVTGIGVSADWTRTLRVAPVVGRTFSPAEEAQGADARVVLLGHHLWQRTFGGDAGVLGTTVSLDGSPYAVIGVMPAQFNYPYGADLWIPDTFLPSDVASGPNVAARLRDGESMASTQRALDALSAEAADVYPDTHGSIRFLAVPQRVDLLGNQPRLGWVLLGSVGFLLLIASANVANLLTVRAVSSRRERALHTALGASRVHHVRRLLIESALLAAVGGGLGIAGATLLLGPMASLSVPPDGSLGAFFTDLRLDHRVLGFAVLATVATTLLFGVGPALRTLRDQPMEELRDGGRSGDGAGGLRSGLVVAEIALAVMLLAGAVLLVRDYARLQSTDPGFATGNRLVASLALPPMDDTDGSDRIRFLQATRDGLLALPGVTDASWVNHLPVSDGSVTRAISAENGPQSEPESLVLANMRAIGPRYFRTMGMRLVAGRVPTDAEVRDGDRVAVITRSAAAHYWPGQEAVGRRVRMGLAQAPSPWLTVVGVLSDVREEWELEDTWYVPSRGSGLDQTWLVVRTDGPVPGLAQQLRGIIRAEEPDQPIDRIVAFDQLVAQTYTSERVGTRVVAAFATIGLLLAVLGIYGVVSYTVSRSSRAMGIRLALGAGTARVKAHVLTRSAYVIALGLALGTVGALVLTRGLARFLVGDGRLAVHTLRQQSALRPMDYVAVAALLAGVALLATYLPARRASRVDPVSVLREE